MFIYLKSAAMCTIGIVILAGLLGLIIIGGLAVSFAKLLIVLFLISLFTDLYLEKKEYLEKKQKSSHQTVAP